MLEHVLSAVVLQMSWHSDQFAPGGMEQVLGSGSAAHCFHAGRMPTPNMSILTLAGMNHAFCIQF